MNAQISYPHLFHIIDDHAQSRRRSESNQRNSKCVIRLFNFIHHTKYELKISGVLSYTVKTERLHPKTNILINRFVTTDNYESNNRRPALGYLLSTLLKVPKIVTWL
jgi:hypothetical protein